MNAVEFKQLQEVCRRRPLTSNEEAQLQAWFVLHPEAQAGWEDDAALDEVLRQLPDAPLASNFTAQVLMAVEHAGTEPSARFSFRWWEALTAFGWARPTAVGALLVMATMLSVQQYHSQGRAEMADSLKQVSTVATVPSVEMLKDFEAIRRLGQVPPNVDEELLAALQ